MMRTNVKNRAAVGATDRPSTASLPKSPTELAPPSSPAEPERRRTASWAEDWSDPSRQPKMDAIWPLLWLAVPLVSLVLYGLITGR